METTTLSETQPLECGSLTGVFDSIGLKNVRYGSISLFERLYVAVRDPVWNTVPGVVRVLSRDVRVGSTSIQMEARHVSEDLDFVWTGALTADDTGRIDFEIDGRFLTDSSYCKVGLNIHHDLSQSLGRPYRAHSDQTSSRGTLPIGVSSGEVWRELFDPFDHLEIEIGEDAMVAYEFEGDLFAMQDHRNWSDANLKTYGTPLSEGFPRQAARGERMRQRLIARYVGSKVVNPARARTRTPELHIGEPLAMPKLGTDLAIGSTPLGELNALVSRVGLDFVRIEFDLAKDEDGSVLLEKLEAVESVIQSIVAAIRMAGLPANISRLVTPLRPTGIDLHFDVLGPTGKGVAEQVARLLPPARISLGSFDSFAELHTIRPTLPKSAGVCFPISPGFHVYDDESILRSTSIQSQMVDAARVAFGIDRDIHVMPVTLIPRGGPYARGPTGESTQSADNDPRQHETFAAVWTALSLTQMIQSGVTSVSYFELLGPNGIIDDDHFGVTVETLLTHLAPRPAASLVRVLSAESVDVYGFAVDTVHGWRAVLVTPGDRSVSVRFPSNVPVGHRSFRLTAACVDHPDVREFLIPNLVAQTVALEPRSLLLISPADTKGTQHDIPQRT